MRLVKRFKTDANGSTAMMFGLSLVPLMGILGAAVDYSHAASVQSEIQKSVDAAALSLVRSPTSSTPKQLAEQAAHVFNANFRPNGDVTLSPLTVRRDGKVITVSTDGRVRTAVVGVIGLEAMDVAAKASVTSGGSRIEIALVLDNTGSMAEAGKMVELKKAINKFVDDLTAMRNARDDVRVSIVPFNTQVKLDDGERNANWLRYDVKLENRNLQANLREAPSARNWAGCVSDRDQRYDASDAVPNGMQQTQYVAATCHYAGLARTQMLTDNLDSIRDIANSMQPNGATNVTIGLTTGLATLNPDHPFGAKSAKTADVQKFLVLLTDGENTQNRWIGTGADNRDNQDAIKQIDLRLSTACDEARKSRVQVFTIKVIEGSSKLLKDCASDRNAMFKEVRNATEITPVFDQILKAMTGIRFTS